MLHDGTTTNGDVESEQKSSFQVEHVIGLGDSSNFMMEIEKLLMQKHVLELASSADPTPLKQGLKTLELS
jgi:hypothetical protein